MPLDFFVENKDTGFNYGEAIQPVVNGEYANQAVFQRPSENIRTRSEDIRKQFDLLEAVVASDRGLTIMATNDTYVDWDSVTGKFLVNDQADPVLHDRDFWIVPLLSTAQGPAGTPPETPVVATFVYNDSAGGGGVFVTEANAELRDHGDTGASRRSGANNLYIEIVESSRTSGGVIIGVSGDEDVGLTFPADGPVLISVEMEQGGNTAAEIVAALRTAGDHDAYININSLKTLVLASGNCAKEVARCRFADGDYYDAGGGTIYRSMGAVDPESILINSAELTSFFAIADNELGEGDMLVVNFTGADDRLNNQKDTSMSDMLQKVSSLSGGAWEKIDSGHTPRRHVIPICKVFDGNLYFLNGTMFESGKPGRLVPSPGDIVELETAYNLHIGGIADKHADADITAGAEAGTGDPSQGTTLPVTLDDSQVRKHIQDVLLAVNRHMDGTVAGFLHPEGDVTAAEKIRDSFTISGASVGAQLGELATAIDNHIDGSEAGYKHPVTDITYRPSVIVDTAGHGDYATITNALTALKDTGGCIYVKPGTYTDRYDAAVVGDIVKPIDIIGTGEVIWQSAEAFTYKVVSGHASSRVTFYNIYFKTFGATYSPIIFQADTDEDAILRFVGCKFEVLATTSLGPIIEVARNQVIFEKCYFVDKDSTHRVVLIQSETVSRVSVSGCRFFRCGQIWKATAACTQFEFVGNRVEECGYTQNGSDVGWLFEGVTYEHDRINISNNDIGTSNARCVQVVTLSGSISNNTYKCTGTFASPVGTQYCMDIRTPAEYYHVVVSGNLMYPGPFSGAYIDGGVHFSGNDMQNIDPVYSTGYGVSTGSTDRPTIAKNTIVNVSTVLFTCIYISADNVSCEGNTVIGAANGGSGIFAAGDYTRVIGNRVDGSPSAARGIYLQGQHGICNGNHIYNHETGIDVYSQGVVSDNYIYITASAGTGIVMVGTGDLSVVNGNKIIGVTNGKGIDCSASGIISCTFVGNHISGCLIGIDLTGATRFVCSGNVFKVPDVAGSRGIDVHRTSVAVPIYGAITNNVIVRDASSENTGSFGIDIAYCDRLEVTGNSIWEGEFFEEPIYCVGAVGVGTGANISADNTDTYNSFWQIG